MRGSPHSSLALARPVSSFRRMLRLYTPDRTEIAVLLAGPARFRSFVVVEGALPPAFLLERANVPGDGDWLIPRLFFDEAGGEIVGSGCVKSEPRDRKVEIGYGIAPGRHNRGHATAAVALMVNAAFDSALVDAVLASALPGNGPSRRVLEKCGLRVCGAGMDEEGPVERWSRVRPPNATSASS